MSENIMLIICGILITYLLFKQMRQPYNTQEHFADPVNTDVQGYVKDTYLADVNAIRTISAAAAALQTNTGLQFPGDVSITGNFNLLPSGVMMMWFGYDIPGGWILCNGEYNTPNLNSKIIKNPAGDIVYIIRK